MSKGKTVYLSEKEREILFHMFGWIEREEILGLNPQWTEEEYDKLACKVSYC